MDGKLPGAMMLELNVDSLSDTGGTSGMCSMGPACLGTAKIKGNVRGLDATIYIAFDAQDFDSITAWCRDCKGFQGNCFLKTDYCDIPSETYDCGTADCYKGITPGCDWPTANCYESGNTCQPAGFDADCDTCFELVNECPQPTDLCNDGRYNGEWFAVTLEPPQQSAPYFARGRLEPPPQGGPNATANSVCFDLPYKRILTRLKGPGTASFNVALAEDPANLQWHICALEDGIVGGNDYLEEDPFCMNAVDAIPDDGTTAAALASHGCYADLNNDGQVQGLDTIEYKAGYNRTQYLGAPCPNCNP